MNNNNFRIVLYFIIFFAVILRFFKIKQLTYITQDEASVYLTSLTNSFSQLFLRQNYFYEHYTNPPFVFVKYKVFLIFFDEPWLIRLPSLLYSIFSIFIGKKILEILFSNKVKYITYFTLFFFSNFIVHISLLGRTYSCSIFFMLLSFYIILKEKNKNSKYSPLLIMTLILAILSDYNTLWPTMALLLYSAYNSKAYNNVKNSILLAIILFTPWWYIFITTFTNAIATKEQSLLPPSLFSLYFSDLRAQFYKTFFTIEVVLAIFLIIYILSRKNNEQQTNKQLLIFFVLIPYSVIIIFNLFNINIIDYKNQFWINFVLFYLMIETIAKLGKRQNLIYLIILFICLTINLLTFKDYSIQPKYPDRVYQRIVKELTSKVHPKSEIKIYSNDKDIDPLKLYLKWNAPSLSVSFSTLNDDKNCPKSGFIVHIDKHDKHQYCLEKQNIDQQKDYILYKIRPSSI